MIEKPIFKEIKEYKEKLLLGLNVRQLGSTALTLAICVPTYIFSRPYLGDDIASWLCIIIAFPTIAIGFFKYNGMNFEDFIKAVIKYMFFIPAKRKNVSENYFEELIKMDELEAGERELAKVENEAKRSEKRGKKNRTKNK